MQESNSTSIAEKILLATVKGDVHDIGKNIVGVVLACNNYEIIDLGVMVPAEKILEEARGLQVDIIGLSGLITPSLDEMVYVAKEMTRLDYQLPLLIGGATTSDKHTAVRIVPHYDHGVVHVLDASRSVGVVEQLINEEVRDDYLKEYRAAQIKTADRYQQRDVKLVPYKEALSRRFETDWTRVDIASPSFTGVRTIKNIPLAEIRPYIDWSPFFMAWELKGKYPEIFKDDHVGQEAQNLFGDAEQLLDRIVDDQLLTANACYAFWPAGSEGDDIVLFTDDTRAEELARFHLLRQQWERKGQKSFRSLADYIAPVDSGCSDYLGGFVVTAGIGCDALCAEFDAQHDDYNSIIAKALADRLAEALTEKMHREARLEWGFGAKEKLINEELIQEKYRGIRPAAGYPACPDHTEKQTLFELLDAEQATGVQLTESFAMLPAASVSGIYFAHPEARYFAVDRITRDQVASYAQRKGWSIETAQRWLGPNLGYDPV